MHGVPKVYTIYSHTCIFGTEVHKSNIQVKRWHNKCENSELDWKTQLLFKLGYLKDSNAAAHSVDTGIS